MPQQMQADTATAASDFYAYLSHRSNEDLSYQKLAKDAARILSTQAGGTAAGEYVVSTSDAFNMLARPLLRTGVLSFRGNGTYGLTATQHITDQLGSIVCINAPDFMSGNKFGDHTTANLEAISLGITRVPRQTSQLPGTASSFDLLALLSGMPAISDLISTSEEWPQHKRGTPEPNWLLVPGDKPWTSERAALLEDRRVLVFKTSEEPAAPRVVRLDRQLYHVPSLRSNPAAYPLTLLLADCTTSESPRMFVREPGAITIISPYFPAELERALWLGSLITSECVVNGFAERRTYMLSPQHLSELDRILLR